MRGTMLAALRMRPKAEVRVKVVVTARVPGMCVVGASEAARASGAARLARDVAEVFSYAGGRLNGSAEAFCGDDGMGFCRVGEVELSESELRYVAGVLPKRWLSDVASDEDARRFAFTLRVTHVLVAEPAGVPPRIADADAGWTARADVKGVQEDVAPGAVWQFGAEWNAKGGYVAFVGETLSGGGGGECGVLVGRHMAATEALMERYARGGFGRLRVRWMVSSAPFDEAVSQRVGEILQSLGIVFTYVPEADVNVAHPEGDGGALSEAAEECIAKALELDDLGSGDEPPVVLLCRFMRMLSPTLLRRLNRRESGRIGCLSVHPSLLPAFPGARCAARQEAAGVRVRGATVHVVAPALDAGPIVHQRSYLAGPATSLSEVARRAAKCEGAALAEAARLLGESRVIAWPPSSLGDDNHGGAWAFNPAKVSELSALPSSPTGATMRTAVFYPPQMDY